MLPIANNKHLFQSRCASEGVTLLEVLIAIGILTVGLLGVAAVIPLAGRQVMEATKADRAAACAQAVLRDLRVRGFLNPYGWRYHDGSNVVQNISGQYLLQRRTYVIDPMFVASKSGDANVTNFPYGATPTNMARVTFARTLGSNAILSSLEAERLCTWPDDLLFLKPDDPEERPRAFVLADTGSNTVARVRWPVRSTDGVAGTPQALRNEIEGNFTWMLTVTPVGRIVQVSGIDYVNVDEPLSYQVSVVVYFNRNLAFAAENERAINPVSFIGGGLSGGDVELTNASTEELRENHWMMVRCAPSAAIGPYEWYRVVATDEWDASPSTRYVTLEGSDWSFFPDHSTAVWCSDVIGVFTATIPAEDRG